jgi:outer membrane protein
MKILKKITLWIMILLMLASMVVYGRDEGTVAEKWGLEDVIRHAHVNNLRVKSAELAEYRSSQELRRARNDRWPSVSGNVSQSLTNSNNVDPVIGGFQTQSSYAGSFSVNAGVTLFGGGYINNNIAQRRIAEQVASLDIEEARNSITMAVTQTYLNTLYAHEALLYRQEVLEASRAQLERSKILFEVGSITRKDLAQMEAQFAGDEYALVDAQNRYDLTILQLKQLLEIPADQSFQLEYPEVEAPVIELPEFEAVRASAFVNMPEIKSSKMEVEMAELEVAKTRAASSPVVSLNAGASTGYSNRHNYEFIDQVHGNFYQQVGVGIRIPILNNNNRANVEIARSNQEQVRMNKQLIENNLRERVETTYADAVAGKQRLNAASKQLSAAEESYRLANEQFELGMLNTIELLQEKNNFLYAQQEYIQAKYTALLNSKIVDFYMGERITL